MRICSCCSFLSSRFNNAFRNNLKMLSVKRALNVEWVTLGKIGSFLVRMSLVVTQVNASRDSQENIPGLRLFFYVVFIFFFLHRVSREREKGLHTFSQLFSHHYTAIVALAHGKQFAAQRLAIFPENSSAFREKYDWCAKSMGSKHCVFTLKVWGMYRKVNRRGGKTAHGKKMLPKRRKNPFGISQ